MTLPTIISFISCKPRVKPLEPLPILKKWMESNTERKILKLKTDRGGEYSSSGFMNHLSLCSIDTERGPASQPTSNSVAKRFNLTLLGKMRFQFEESSLPLHLWEELAMYTSIQINSSPSVAINNNSPTSLFTPFLKGHHHPVKPTRLHPFGCLAYVHEESAAKLGPNARRMIFVGLESTSNASRFWDKTTQKIIVSSNAVFDEFTFPAKASPQSPPLATIMSTFDYSELILESVSNIPSLLSRPSFPVNTKPVTAPELVNDLLSLIPEPPPTAEPPVPPNPDPPPLRRSTRQAVKPKRYGYVTQIGGEESNDNPTYKEAIEGAHQLHWKAAMDAEWESFCHHNVGTLVEPPLDANVLEGMQSSPG